MSFGASMARDGARPKTASRQSDSSSSIIASPAKKCRLDAPRIEGPHAAQPQDTAVFLAEVDGFEREDAEDVIAAEVEGVLRTDGLQRIDVQGAATSWWRKARSGRVAQHVFWRRPPKRLEAQAWTFFQPLDNEDALAWATPVAHKPPDISGDRDVDVPQDGQGMLARADLQSGLLHDDNHDQPFLLPTVPDESTLANLIKLHPTTSDDSTATVDIAARTARHPVEFLIPVHLPAQRPHCPGQSKPQWFAHEHLLMASQVRQNQGPISHVVWTPEALKSVIDDLARLSGLAMPASASVGRSDFNRLPRLVFSPRADETGEHLSIVLPWSHVRQVRWMLAQLRVSRSVSRVDTTDGQQPAGARPGQGSRGRRPLALVQELDDGEVSTASEDSTDTITGMLPQGVFLPVRDWITRVWIARC
ncbi:hypothetical protein OC842_004107 [Tilletia horrida]|uniref:Uncharacterized protein n=1 Tax=Tilletia horrida TaxID=155126 RepID=A0AAN6GAA5_9BASI|nr:hypothetical protein OC842_004107 [Tilletia horrida]